MKNFIVDYIEKRAEEECGSLDVQQLVDEQAEKD